MVSRSVSRSIERQSRTDNATLESYDNIGSRHALYGFLIGHLECIRFTCPPRIDHQVAAGAAARWGLGNGSTPVQGAVGGEPRPLTTPRSRADRPSRDSVAPAS